MLHIHILSPGLKGPRDCSGRSPIVQPCHTAFDLFVAYDYVTDAPGEGSIPNSPDIMQSPCKMMSFCRGTATVCITGLVCSPATPVFALFVRGRCSPETESGIDGFPNGQSVRGAAEPWGSKDASDPVPGVTNKWKPRLELHVRNWNHMVRAVGVARRAKHQMRDATRQPKTKEQPIIPSCSL